MHTTLLTATTALLATLASTAPLTERAAAFKAPKGKGPFNLQVIATAGALKYSGMFLQTYHTGAGQNVLVTENDQSEASKFNFTATTGDVSAYLGPDYTSYLFLESAPKPYGLVGFDAGEPTPGLNFSFTTPGNYLQFPEGDKYVFSVCPSDVYYGEYVPTLVYREVGEKDLNKTCADVKVKAVF